MTYDGTDSDDDGTVEADVDNSAVTTNAVDYNGVTPDYKVAFLQGSQTAADVTITATSYTTAYSMGGVIFPEEVPDGMTLYGRFAIYIDDNSASKFYAKPRFFNVSTNGFKTLDELEITGNNDYSVLDSGWTEITTTAFTTGLVRTLQVRGKVDNNSTEYRPGSSQLQFAGVS